MSRYACVGWVDDPVRLLGGEGGVVSGSGENRAVVAQCRAGKAGGQHVWPACWASWFRIWEGVRFSVEVP
jgi:hypothetical protein